MAGVPTRHTAVAHGRDVADPHRHLRVQLQQLNAIWLITRGGPFGAEGTAAGGGTDLLITYTYRLAFSEATSHYGYAAAMSVMIFLIVSLISVISLSRTNALQEVDR